MIYKLFAEIWFSVDNIVCVFWFQEIRWSWENELLRKTQQPNMSEPCTPPYLPPNVVATIISWATRNDMEDWRRLCLVSHDFHHAAVHYDLSYRRMNLEGYLQPWFPRIPTEAWIQLIARCRRLQNPPQGLRRNFPSAAEWRHHGHCRLKTKGSHGGSAPSCPVHFCLHLSSSGRGEPISSLQPTLGTEKESRTTSNEAS